MTPPPLPDICDDENETSTGEARSVATAAIGDPPRAERRTRIPRAGYRGPARRSATANVGPPPAAGDMKAGLTSSRPRLSILPTAPKVYGTRGLEYGAEKYRRGNYHGSPPPGVAPTERVAGYLDAALRHLAAVTDAYNRAVGTGGDAAAALRVVDDVASGGFPASGLPHLAHALCSIDLAIQCGVDDGLLPADPGQPWRAGRVTEDRSPEAAERHTIIPGFEVWDEDSEQVLQLCDTEEEANDFLDDLSADTWPNVVVRPRRGS